jgi:hypothetical protein
MRIFSASKLRQLAATHRVAVRSAFCGPWLCRRDKPQHQRTFRDAKLITRGSFLASAGNARLTNPRSVAALEHVDQLFNRPIMNCIGCQLQFQRLVAFRNFLEGIRVQANILVVVWSQSIELDVAGAYVGG